MFGPLPLGNAGTIAAASRIAVRLGRRHALENEVPISPLAPFGQSRSSADYARALPNRSPVAFSSSSIAPISSGRTRARPETSASLITSSAARATSA